jgi:hypothetical protein
VGGGGDEGRKVISQAKITWLESFKTSLSTSNVRMLFARLSRDAFSLLLFFYLPSSPYFYYKP